LTAVISDDDRTEDFLTILPAAPVDPDDRLMKRSPAK
jgi:hypothetical protein